MSSAPTPRDVAEEPDSASLFTLDFFVWLSVAFQSFPSDAACTFIFPLYSCPLSFEISFHHAHLVLPSFSSCLLILLSCSLIMFHLWAQATCRLNTKHRGKHCIFFSSNPHFLLFSLSHFTMSLSHTVSYGAQSQQLEPDVPFAVCRCVQ